MITADNIISHEFIGLDAEIVGSTNPQVIGLNGRVINETKSMITMDTDRGPKSVPKAHSDWRFAVRGGDVVVSGSTIAKRPYDRIGARS